MKKKNNLPTAQETSTRLLGLFVRRRTVPCIHGNRCLWKNPLVTKKIWNETKKKYLLRLLFTANTVSAAVSAIVAVAGAVVGSLRAQIYTSYFKVQIMWLCCFLYFALRYLTSFDFLPPPPTTPSTSQRLNVGLNPLLGQGQDMSHQAWVDL